MGTFDTEWYVDKLHRFAPKATDLYAFRYNYQLRSNPIDDRRSKTFIF